MNSLRQHKNFERGFSLIESIFALFLTFLVLSALTFLLRQISLAKTTIKEGGVMAEIFHASSLIRLDLGASQGNVLPLSGSAEELRMNTLAPDLNFEFDVENPNNLNDRYIATNARSWNQLCAWVYDLIRDDRARGVLS